MSKKLLLNGFLILFLASVLFACNQVGSPSETIEAYLEALVAKDEILAVNLSCASWEEQASVEGAAYEGVEVSLDNVSCAVVDDRGESASVSCKGEIVFSYAGGEDQVDELEGRLFEAALEDGEWKMCGYGNPKSSAAITEVAGSPTPQPEQDDPTETPLAPQSTPTITETPKPTFTPTPDTRLLPEQWQKWPVIPTLSPWLTDVYEKGLEMGNNPNAFSKVGDCQNIPQAFLGIYETDRYSLNANYLYLQETIDHFAGSWGRDGFALDGGFNFPAIFTSLRADPELCNSGETPLECEIRVHKPTFIIIAMEFVYEKRTAENYEAYLRQAVEYALSQNVIPILVTKADNVEGNHSINLATVKIAYEYDVPLWNWWLAAQGLPGEGIDWDRGANGFYITVAGWDMRSFTALQVLDSLRISLLNP